LWTWYGTKNVRATIHEVAGSKDEVVRLRSDMEEIEAKARAAEAARDAAKTKSPWFSYSAMALQLAIVLSSAAILAVMMTLFYVSLGVGGIGALLFFIALGA
jgi:ABC-type multidrug transport system fused ATPase/permease subunit